LPVIRKDFLFHKSLADAKLLFILVVYLSETVVIEPSSTLFTICFGFDDRGCFEVYTGRGVG